MDEHSKERSTALPGYTKIPLCSAQCGRPTVFSIPWYCSTSTSTMANTKLDLLVFHQGTPASHPSSNTQGAGHAECVLSAALLSVL